MVGILNPSRGLMLVDGLDLKQASLEWWRMQIAYLPQEPSFLNATIRENVIMTCTQVDELRLAKVIQSVGSQTMVLTCHSVSAIVYPLPGL